MKVKRWFEMHALPRITAGRIIDVYFKPQGIWCDPCQSDNCTHVTFALSLPEVQRILNKKRWKIK